MTEKKNAYDGLIEEYDKYYTDKPGRWKSDKRNRFAEKIIRKHTSSPGVILDVGCGNGHTIAHFQRAFPEAALHGIDLSPVACEIAWKETGARIWSGSIEEYSPGFGFDLILCMGTAEHFLDVGLGLEAMRTLLEPGGFVYLEVPNNLSYSRGRKGYRRLKKGSRQMEWHLPRHDWVKLVQGAGFAVVETVRGPSKTWEYIWVLNQD